MGLTQNVTVGFCDATSCSLLGQIISDYLLLPTNALPVTFLKNWIQVMQGEITACQKFRGRVYR